MPPWGPDKITDDGREQAARPRLQHLVHPVPRRVVEVAPARLDGWLERFHANNPEGPQRIVGQERFDHDPLAVILVRRGGYAVGVATGGA